MTSQDAKSSFVPGALQRAEAINCPVLALWAANGALPRWYDILAIWREWADDVRGGPIASGHFMAEEAPDQTTAELRSFFST